MASEGVMRKVKIEGGYLRFSAAHFITFGGKCERLHGHNYGVLVEIEGELGKDKLVFDFTILKRLTREICRHLNHHFLLPMHNPHLQLHLEENTWEIHFQDKRYLFPVLMSSSFPSIIRRLNASPNTSVPNCSKRSLSTIPQICIRLWWALKSQLHRWRIINVRYV